MIQEQADHGQGDVEMKVDVEGNMCGQVVDGEIHNHGPVINIRIYNISIDDSGRQSKKTHTPSCETLGRPHDGNGGSDS